nr:MAG TPA: hypothetical protein [Caudoviricetes sp.]DAR55001.1 MAG TPA: hypothetical protein [Bacteriophage sp.]
MPSGFLYALEKGQYKFRRKLEKTQIAERRGSNYGRSNHNRN